MALCPCGSDREYEACCAPYVEGREAAPTAEALMRSRYTAHTLGRFDYLNETVHPDIRDETNPAEMEEWSKNVDWKRLQILSCVGGSETDEKGEVDFEAHYAIKGIPQLLREDAFFRRENGRWFYVDGNVYGQEPIRRASPKVGRNDACPCGSGKKYKKCCGS